MPEQDAVFAIAGQPRRLHEAGVAADIGFRACDAGIEREVHDRGRDDDVLHGVAERGHDPHRQHEQRERHDSVGDAADDAVGPAAEKAGRDSRKPAHEEHQRDRGDRDERIEPGSHHDTAEDVAAELVGAEPMRRRRRPQRRRCVAGERIIRHDPRTEDRGEQDQHQQSEGKAGDLVLGEHIAGVPDQGG
ncbi:hypothetical protein NS341_13500, partial [Staphylococcus xylosus]